MEIYNTLSRKNETFKPIVDGKVTMYGCGVTPYKPSHLGHALQGVVFDVFRRYFEYKGYKVTYVRNYTDIDDKIVDRAKSMGIHPLALSKEIIAQCDYEFKQLRVREADHQPKVSDHVNGIIEMIKVLIAKGYAYETKEHNVYFAVNKFDGYGKLSNQKIENLEHGVRKDIENDKIDPNDFALWKSAHESEKLWDSPWGHGRPGWHIECSVMSSHFLGDHFDIHGGGADLVFPHHENEIAQSEAAHNGVFSNYWVHNGLLMVGNDKMSKSLNNDISIGKWLKKYHPEVIRYLILTNHYRSNVQFDPKRYRDANKKVFQTYKTLQVAESKIIDEVNNSGELYEGVMKEFESYMDADFNTVRVISLIHEIVRKINKIESRASVLSQYVASIRSIGFVIGLFDLKPGVVLEEMNNLEIANRKLDLNEIEELIKERSIYRQQKKYDKADKLTEKLNGMGIKLIDTETRSYWEFEY